VVQVAAVVLVVVLAGQVILRINLLPVVTVLLP
jgi:hypothetical protein